MIATLTGFTVECNRCGNWLKGEFGWYSFPSMIEVHKTIELQGWKSEGEKHFCSGCVKILDSYINTNQENEKS